MSDFIVPNGSIVGKKQGDYRITLNSISKDYIRCGVCGGNAGKSVGGCRQPLEVFREREFVCPGCSRQHAPELAEILNEYYEIEEKEQRQGAKKSGWD